MTRNRDESLFFPYDDQRVLCTYDKNHTLMFVRNESLNDIYSSKNREGFKPSPEHKRRFLSAYDLSEHGLQEFPTREALHSYMQRIADENHCIPQLLDTQGLSHLKDKKKEHKINYTGPSIHLNNEICEEWSRGVDHPRLPVLTTIKTILQSSVYREHYELALENTLVIIVQQGFATVEPMIRTVIELGVPKHNIVLFTKPHTTTADTKSMFKQIGVHYVTSRINEAEENGYDRAIEHNVRTVVQHANTRLTLDASRNIQNIIVHDEGGVLLKNELFFRFLIEQKNAGRTISLSEHTVSGVSAQASAWHRLHIPYISMAHSWLKKDHESFFIAEESFHIAQTMLASHDGRQPIRVGIIGCGGNTGSQFVECFMQYYTEHGELQKFHLHINDKDKSSAKYIKTLALIHRNKVRVHIHENNDTLLKQSDIVFSCTGTDVITPEVYHRLSQPSEDHSVILCNLASGTREFKTLLRGCRFSETSCDYRGRVGTVSFVIKNRGRPIIFNGRNDAVHPLKIDIIRAGTLITLMQHFSYLSHVQRAESSYSADRIVRLDAMLQYAICQSFIQIQKILKQKGLHHLCVKNSFLATIKTINLNSIIQRSEGSPIRQINVVNPSSVNLIGEYDKNHGIYYLLDTKKGAFDFYFIKHGKRIADPNMVQQFFENIGESIDRFYAANFIDRFFLVSTLCKTKQHAPSGSLAVSTPITPLRALSFYKVVWTESNGNHQVTSNRQVLKHGKEIDGAQRAREKFIKANKMCI